MDQTKPKPLTRNATTEKEMPIFGVKALLSLQKQDNGETYMRAAHKDSELPSSDSPYPEVR